MKEYLTGENPLHIEDIWNLLYRGAFYRGGPVLMSAIAGIDQALWDIKGKYHGVPAYELMGGPCRNSMKDVYKRQRLYRYSITTLIVTVWFFTEYG